MHPRGIIVEGDKKLRTSFALCLEERDFEVVACPAPLFCQLIRDPKCLCPHAHPCADVLLYDLNVVGRTGLDFVRKQYKRGCKVLAYNMAVLSEAFTIPERILAIEIGCELFEKPLNLTQFGQWLEVCEKRLEPDRILTPIADLFREM